MIKFLFLLLLSSFVFFSCNETPASNSTDSKNQISEKVAKLNDSTQTNRSHSIFCKNDSLNELAFLISGKKTDTTIVLTSFLKNYTFTKHSENFETKWSAFEKKRMIELRNFQKSELSNVVSKTETLFYPFSGPDILHAQTFFPDANHYVLMGLEPVGTLPVFDHPEDVPDSMSSYYNKINTSLHAILNFSFFRTISMSSDLKNQEVDGTLHLLILFISRNGNSLCSAKPFVLDTTGNLIFLSDFSALKKSNELAKGIEIRFTTPTGEQKTVHYFSLDLSNQALAINKPVLNYLNKLKNINTYLKGASYLMHNTGFSIVRNYILKNSQNVIQDDSGISIKYFEETAKWTYSFYGNYVKPIKLFASRYQKDLDSLYKTIGSKPLGFGLGYNFKDKNSNLMIAKRK